MHESDQPAGETDELDTTPVDDVVVDTESAEPELDELNNAFDTVDAALKALDSDDLDQAEALRWDEAHVFAIHIQSATLLSILEYFF